MPSHFAANNTHLKKQKNRIVLSHLKFRYWIDRKQHELNVKIHFPRQFIVPIDKSWVKKEKISCETVCHCILTLGGFVLLIFQCRFLASSFVLFCLQDTLCVPMIAKCSCGNFQLQTKKRVSLSHLFCCCCCCENCTNEANWRHLLIFMRCKTTNISLSWLWTNCAVGFDFTLVLYVTHAKIF